MEKKHLIAVYGTLKKGENNHRKLIGAEFVGEGCLNGSFGIETAMGLPVLRPTQKDYKVSVEVYRVDDDLLAELDFFESHPRIYHRQPVALTMADGSQATAEAYVATPTLLQHQPEEGKGRIVGTYRSPFYRKEETKKSK